MCSAREAFERLRLLWLGESDEVDDLWADDVVVYDATDPAVAAGEWEATGSVLATGSPVTVHGFLVLRARGGEIVELRDYMDVLGTHHALGRLPRGGGEARVNPHGRR